jgi:1-deoxy-D-xylulose-5-phosphate synthase
LDPQPRALPLGQADLLRDGEDLAILALGNTVSAALEASELLTAQGVSCAVVDARFAKPLDERLILELADRVRGLITVEEHALAGGFGTAVLELLAQRRPGTTVFRVGVPDEFVEHGKQSTMRADLGLDPAGIAAQAMRAFPSPVAASTRR